MFFHMSHTPPHEPPGSDLFNLGLQEEVPEATSQDFCTSLRLFEKTLLLKRTSFPKENPLGK